MNRFAISKREHRLWIQAVEATDWLTDLMFWWWRRVEKGADPIPPEISAGMFRQVRKAYLDSQER